MWVVNYQDFRNHLVAMEKPPVMREYFPAEIEAINRKAELQRCGLTACITKFRPPQAKKKRAIKKATQTTINDHLGSPQAFNANWSIDKDGDW